MAEIKDKLKEEKVVESAPIERLPRQEPPKQVTLVTDDFKQSVLYTLYIMYKGNLLTRHNLSEMVKIMNKPVPEGGVAKYLVDEAAKA